MPEHSIYQTIFHSRSFPLIAGPCVIESREHTLKMAEAICTIADPLNIAFIFKSSYDKANRTSIRSYRGPGLDDGLKILEAVKANTGVPVLTDVHNPAEARAAAQVVDVLQIPAFLCRQTDLLVAAAQTGKPVNVKKGQFLGPEKVSSIVEKLKTSGACEILITERGTMFGYDRLVVDMSAIPIMQRLGYPVIFDGTHSVQVPGKPGGLTGGQREFSPPLIRAAVAAGCDGLFMEVHDDVDHAKSDAATQWPLDRLNEVLTQVCRIRDALKELR
ncbi:MAG: 3-deoxy-8-phosphooctulonate synthase [FCB group bacterium]|nr:3-deoxy-8-phosphooctulonate synthase [FCB group bacterium]